MGSSRTDGTWRWMKWRKEADMMRATGSRETRTRICLPVRFFPSNGIRDGPDSAVLGDFGEVMRGKGYSGAFSGTDSEMEGGVEGSSAGGGAGIGMGDGGGVNMMK